MKENRFINREESWVDFNARVLSEGLRNDIPLLERLKFLAIVSSNFDEFFVVRVARLINDAENGNTVRCPSGKTPRKILKKVLADSYRLIEKQYRCYNDELLPSLKEIGLTIKRPENYNSDDKDFLENYFSNELFANLTPRMVEPQAECLKALGNQSLTAVFALPEEKLGFIAAPANLERFIFLPDNDGVSVALLEDVILNFGEKLFDGCEMGSKGLFRILRDADMGVDEERDDDFMDAMKEILIDREFSFPVRLDSDGSSPELTEILKKRLNLPEERILMKNGPLSLKDFMELSFLGQFSKHQYPRWTPSPVIMNGSGEEDKSIWDTLKEKDVLLHHPYDSFDPVVRMVEEAAVDEGVLTIKMTLYRTSGNSPLIKALEKAARNGKQVVVVVELKARFDEGRNIGWASRLEKAGCIVIYGVAGLKVHAKALLIIRRENEGVVRYIHLGTGNYNDKTAGLYTDMGYMTSRKDLSYEAALFFNAVTGYSRVPRLKHLAMSPYSLRGKVVSLIEREIAYAEKGNPGKMMIKMNSLADADMIELLYKASQAGVKIKLNIRGVCCLVPGVKGMSENIEVVSIIDRFLEHTRLFFFSNQGKGEVFLSSADWMGRNLNRRVELFFPIRAERITRQLEALMNEYFKEDSQAHLMQSDGSWKRKTGGKLRIQFELCRKTEEAHQAVVSAARQDLKVRRKK